MTAEEPETIEITGHVSHLIANLTTKALDQVKADFTKEVIRNGYTPATDVEVRRAKLFTGTIDLSADSDGYRYYLSVKALKK